VRCVQGRGRHGRGSTRWQRIAARGVERARAGRKSARGRGRESEMVGGGTRK
jgi:hypothetical protein